MSVLSIMNNEKPLLNYRLSRAETRVGSGEINDLVIPSDEVKKYHFVLRLQAAGCRLFDKTGAGVSVNGRKVNEAVLKDGDVIALGGLSARYCSREPAGLKGSAGALATEVICTETEGERPPAAVLYGADGRETDLSGGVVNIGTEEGNHFRLRERYVSGFHCRLYSRGGTWRIMDLGSTNGTFVNGVRTLDSILPDPSVITVGRAELEFRLIRAEAAVPGFCGIVGASPAMRAVFDLIPRMAASGATVLLTGETGTGKELAAQAIHDLSPLKSGPFIPVNCAAISRDIVESELFGHEKGAFTGATASRKGAFEDAAGGTLFLDEVGEVTPEVQTKLLRAVEYGEIKRVGSNRPMKVSARIVAATNRDLSVEVREGRFRGDLYYRLAVLPLCLPPLRERKGDVPVIAGRIVSEMSGGRRALNREALEKLDGYQWPGNVRELKNVLTRAMVMTEGPEIGAEFIRFMPAA